MQWRSQAGELHQRPTGLAEHKSILRHKKLDVDEKLDGGLPEKWKIAAALKAHLETNADEARHEPP
jgi:hypothetical protein